MNSDVEKAMKRSTECLKTPIVPSLCLQSHRREPRTLVNGTPSQWILEFAPNADSSITFARLSTLISKIISITFEKIGML